MPIVSSYIAEDRIQIDGRRSIIETHTDHRGVIQQVFYLAEPDADVDATMLARVSMLDAQLTANTDMTSEVE